MQVDVAITRYPRRIVCLTEETTETLYLLGEEERIAGVSGYTVRPPEARKKPRVSAFITAKFDKIMDLQPDLVLAFSDLQAGISAELIKRGVNVLTFNQRSVTEILQMMLTLGRIVGAGAKAEPRRPEMLGTTRLFGGLSPDSMSDFAAPWKRRGTCASRASDHCSRRQFFSRKCR